MIDMSGLYIHVDYPAALTKFNHSTKRKKWSEFKDVHLKVTNHKCPICECSLKEGELLTRNSGAVSDNTETEIIATVDHYRPQAFYAFLAMTPENYILMCSECNNIYKGCEFPLFDIPIIRATTVGGISSENPLIVNPILDDLLELFNIVARIMTNGRKVLELKPKHTVGYLYEKAITTIKLFSLGECDVVCHNNTNVKNLRINLLHSHFVKFEPFIDAFINKDLAKMRSEITEKNLTTYGFFKFFVKKQFINLSP
jgi:hypothetical protein